MVPKEVIDFKVNISYKIIPKLKISVGSAYPSPDYYSGD